MGATNSTLHYNLSQFISTDKPAWLQDYNGDMQKIDTGINGALTAAESAQNSADSASSGVSTLSDSVSALTTTVSGHTSDITDLSGDVNTIESLIGNGTPTAGDRTIIGASNANTDDINSLKAVVHMINGTETLTEKQRITGTGGSYTITEDGLYQFNIGVGATTALSNAKIEANNVELIVTNTSVAYGNACAIYAIKAGTVLTCSSGTATTNFVINKINY